MFTIWMREAGQWWEIDYHEDFFCACYIASAYVRLHGEASIRMKNEKGEVLA